MSELKVITNNQPRLLIYGYELTETEKAEFDYIDPEELETHDFFRYKGQVYDPGEFQTTRGLPEDNPIRAWDGYQNDSFFSGIVIKYPREEWGDYDTERIIVGWFYC